MAGGSGVSPVLHAANVSMIPTKSRFTNCFAVGRFRRRYCIVDILSYIIRFVINHTDDGESPKLILKRNLPLSIDIALWILIVIVVIAINR